MPKILIREDGSTIFFIVITGAKGVSGYGMNLME